MPLKADTVTKDYVKDAGVFADIFNYYIYGGRQVILPEHLTERDSTKIALPYGADGVVVPIQRFRDVQKLYANLKYKYGNRHFWCRGYYVDTVGKNAKKIEEYIRNQLKEDLEYDQMSLKEYIDPFTGEPVNKSKKK